MPVQGRGKIVGERACHRNAGQPGLHSRRVRDRMDRGASGRVLGRIPCDALLRCRGWWQGGKQRKGRRD